MRKILSIMLLVAAMSAIMIGVLSGRTAKAAINNANAHVTRFDSTPFVRGADDELYMDGWTRSPNNRVVLASDLTKNLAGVESVTNSSEVTGIASLFPFGGAVLGIINLILGIFGSILATKAQATATHAVAAAATANTTATSVALAAGK
jgi:hypothetical protein